MRWVAGALLWGATAACPAPEAVPEAPVVEAPAPLEPEVVVFEPARRTAAAPEVRVEVLHAVASREEPNFPWVVDVTLGMRWLRAFTFDGDRMTSRSVAVRRADVVLLVDGAVVAPEADPDPDPQRTGFLIVPFEPPFALTEALSYALPAGALPADVVLRVGTTQGHVDVVLAGAPSAEGRGVIVQPQDPWGRGIAAPGTVTAGEAAIVREGKALGYEVPAVPGTLQLAVDGYAPAEVTLADPLPATLPVTLVPEDGAADALPWVSAFEPADRISPARPYDRVSAGLRTVDEATAFVRDTIAVLPTNGVRRGSDAILRLGAGSPHERAMLLRHLLSALDVEGRIVCGDLEPHQAEAIYTDAVDLPDLPAPYSAWVAELTPQVDALSEGWAAAPAPPGEDPLRVVADLVAEWCWVEVPEGEDTYRQLDLRPPPFDETPLPFQWRTAERDGPELWHLEVTLSAYGRRPGGELGEMELATYRLNAVSLSDAAVVFDLQADARGKTLQARTFAVSDAHVAMREGGSVPLRDLGVLMLHVRWTDPDRMESGTRMLELWNQNANVPPMALRVLFGGDAGVRGSERVAQHLGLAVPGAFPVPGVAAMRAQQDAYEMLRNHLAGGVQGMGASVTVSSLTAWSDGRVGARIERVGPELPAWVGAAPDAAARARFLAADAVARAFVMGVPAPDAPAEWLSTSTDLGKLRTRWGQVQTYVARTLETADYGQSPDAELWWSWAETGAQGWFVGAARDLPTPPQVPRSIKRGDPRWSHAVFDRPVRCAVARLHAPDAVPEVCGAAP